MKTLQTSSEKFKIIKINALYGNLQKRKQPFTIHGNVREVCV